MVIGFLGTLVSLERAVALRRSWTYLSPLLSGLGALALIAWPETAFLPGASALLAGQLLLLACLAHTTRAHPALFHVVMALGAACAAVGTSLWIRSGSITTATPLWIAFLLLTIAAERLELSRVLLLSRRARLQFLAAATAVLVGAVAGLPWLGPGLCAMAVWLYKHDIARRTVRAKQLTRYIGVCLLSGYAWLFVGGLTMASPAQELVPFGYDLGLHAFFLGFVFAMIFAHAPIILPAVIEVPVSYSPYFYGHWALLQISMLIRAGADVSGHAPLRALAGSLNALSILAFFASMLLSMRKRAV